MNAKAKVQFPNKKINASMEVLYSTEEDYGMLIFQRYLSELIAESSFTV